MIKFTKKISKYIEFTKWATAYKFSAGAVGKIKILSRLEELVLIPAAVEPVTGVVVFNALLYLRGKFHRKDIRVGDTIKIQRAGDCK